MGAFGKRRPDFGDLAQGLAWIAHQEYRRYLVQYVSRAKQPRLHRGAPHPPFQFDRERQPVGSSVHLLLRKIDLAPSNVIVI